MGIFFETITIHPTFFATQHYLLIHMGRNVSLGMGIYRSKKINSHHTFVKKNCCNYAQSLQRLRKAPMKRNRFFLTVTALLPLLCICIQSWWTVETVMEAEDNIPAQVVMVPNQLPLEDGRHYAEDAMQYAISVGSITTKLTKWNGECIETSAANEDWCLWTRCPANHAPHQPMLSDGRSVIIRLHHLII